MKKVVAALRVKNEAWVLRYTLSALSEFVDEIVVVDNCSIDGTLDILRSYPKVTKIHLNKPSNENDLDEPKDWNKLTTLARKAGADWILYTDADEMVEPKIKQKITDFIDSEFGVIRFRKVSPWKSLGWYRTDSNRFDHEAKEVLNPILVKMSPSLYWTNGRGGLAKRLIKKVLRGERLKPNLGRVYPHGVSGKCLDYDDLVSVHFNHLSFDRLLRKQVFYALTEKETFPRKSKESIISWVSKGWSEEGASFEALDESWIWKDYVHFIEY